MLNTYFDTFANSILKIDMIFDIRDKKEYKTKEIDNNASNIPLENPRVIPSRTY